MGIFKVPLLIPSYLVGLHLDFHLCSDSFYSYLCHVTTALQIMQVLLLLHKT